MAQANPTPGTEGEVYRPASERSGEKSVVFFTRDLSPEGLLKVYDKISSVLEGKVLIKMHTGEPLGPNIIPRPWVKKLLEERLPEARIGETNVYYPGERYETASHRIVLKTNGWTEFTEVDILDEDGAKMFPIKGGKWFDEMSLGTHIENYDSLLTLTHFKGHTCGGFGGSNKNLGIGCADGRTGKAMIHTGEGGKPFNKVGEEFMERMTESTKAVLDHFGDKVAFINVMRNMSVSCDCEGVAAAPVVTPNVGIVASLDICAIDNACVDCIYAMTEEQHHDLVERMESRHGLRQLTYMKEMGMGNELYTLVDLDNGEKEITAKDAVKHCVPFKLEV